MLKLGTKVRHTTGGPFMTVSKIVKKTGTVTCTWFNEGYMNSCDVHEKELEIVAPDVTNEHACR
jgi:uncharacterized protein YodC (DUF2158 family)